MRDLVRWCTTRVRLVLIIVAALLVAAPLAAAASPPPQARADGVWSSYPLPPPVLVGGKPLPAGAGAAAAAAFAKRIASQEPGGPPAARAARGLAWPAAGQVVIDTGNAGPGSSGSGFSLAGSLPVQVTGTGGSRGQVRVQVESQTTAARAGVHGVLLALTAGGVQSRVGSRVRLRIGYAGFAGMYGGGWSSRLRLVMIPPCVLSTSQAGACGRWHPVPADNDVASSTLNASVMLPLHGRLVLAVTAGPPGPTGDFAATPLEQSGTWAVQQGDFTYDYPIVVPASLGSPAPQVSLSYDSQSMDSETSASNTQAGEIGDGWSDSPGFIERMYEPCSQAALPNVGDECWAGWNAVLSLGGHSGYLVKSGNTWRLQGDDGMTAQLLHGAGNGLWDGEYWLVTTPDGTRYYFGLGHLPGTRAGGPASGSAWGTPVYSPVSGDPCYSKTTGKSSVCANMGWQWNLDYVVSPDGHLTSYTYTPETNSYERGATPTDLNGTRTRCGMGVMSARA